MLKNSRMGAVATFIAGLLTGALVVGGFWLGERPGQASSQAAGPFQDVPAHHWAAQTVADLKSKGLVKGETQNTYAGDQYVTRYEAAVLLDRFVHYIENGRKPLTTKTLDPSKMPVIAPSWAHDPLNDLALNEFIYPKSPLLDPPGNTALSTTQMADALAQVSQRIVDRENAPQSNGAPPED